MIQQTSPTRYTALNISNIDVTYRGTSFYYALLLAGYIQRSREHKRPLPERLKTDDPVDIVVMEKVHKIDIVV